MEHVRYDCAVVAFNEFLYVADGYNGHNLLGDMEKYSLETNQWHEASTIQTEWTGLKLFEFYGKLYLLWMDMMDIVEYYDPDEDPAEKFKKIVPLAQ